MKVAYSLSLAVMLSLNFGIQAARAQSFQTGDFVQITKTTSTGNAAVGMVTKTHYHRPIRANRNVEVHFVGNDNQVHTEHFKSEVNAEVIPYGAKILDLSVNNVVALTSARYGANGAIGTLSSIDDGVISVTYLANDGAQYTEPFNSNEVAPCNSCTLPNSSTDHATLPPAPPQPQISYDDSTPVATYDYDIGDNDLYTYGSYEVINGVTVFVPSVGADWEPYQNGYWLWTGHGWRWRSYDSWGEYTDHWGVWRHHIGPRGSYWVWFRFDGDDYYDHDCTVTFYNDENGMGWSPWYAGYHYAYNDGFDDGYWLGYEHGFHDGIHQDHWFHPGMVWVPADRFSRPGETFYHAGYVVRGYNDHFVYATSNNRGQYGYYPGVAHSIGFDPRHPPETYGSLSHTYVQARNAGRPIEVTTVRTESRTVTVINHQTGQAERHQVQVSRPQETAPVPTDVRQAPVHPVVHHTQPAPVQTQPQRQPQPEPQRQPTQPQREPTQPQRQPQPEPQRQPQPEPQRQPTQPQREPTQPQRQPQPEPQRQPQREPTQPQRQPQPEPQRQPQPEPQRQPQREPTQPQRQPSQPQRTEPQRQPQPAPRQNNPGPRLNRKSVEKTAQ